MKGWRWNRFGVPDWWYYFSTAVVVGWLAFRMARPPTQAEPLITASAPYDAGAMLRESDFYMVANGWAFPVDNTERLCLGQPCTRYVETRPDGGWSAVGICP